MAKESIYNAWSCLKEQKEEYQSVMYGPLNDHIHSLELGLQFLDAIFCISDDENLDLRIEGVVNNVLVELLSLSNRPADGNLVLDLDHGYNNLREMMKYDIINLETREYNVIFLTLFRKVKYLADLNDFVIEGIGYLTMYKDDLISPFLKEKLLFLQALLTYVANVGEQIDGGAGLYGTLETLFAKSACLIYSCLVGKMDEEMELTTNHNLSDLLEKTKVKNIYLAFLRASKIWDSKGNRLKNEVHVLDSLIKIFESNTRLVLYPKDSSMKLHEKLKLLKNSLADLPDEVTIEKFNYLVTSTKAIVSGAIPIIYSFYDEDMKEEMSREVNGSLPELLDQIEQIQVEVKEIREMKLYNYPKTDELGFLDLLLKHMEELLNSCPESIEILKKDIKTLHVTFDSLRSFLRKIKEQHSKHEELQDLWTRIIALAYQAEYIIDFFIVKKVLDSRIKFSISKVIEQTDLIMSEVEGIYDEEKYHTQAHAVAKSFKHLPSQDTEATTNKDIVGFADEAEKIMEYLLGDSKKRDVISIVGMPGLGKTTLAKKMYEDPSIKAHFYIRAWCTVSQTYEKEKLLLSILGNVVTHPDEMKKLEGLDSDDKLNKILMGRRYFIVLDDIWDINVWTDLVRSLPDGNNRSRILITSRLHNVALQVKDGGKVHPLRPFSDHESWELFQKKLLEKESFSQEFLDVGKQIAKSCKGLPLAIVVAAGLLAQLENNILLWKQIAGSLSSHIVRDSETQCMAILELSYKELPDHLKSCFLYIGVFLEDAQILVRDLKWLWISEGFVHNSGEKSLEDIADGYLMDLISRSLLTATKETSQGGVKACGVHDILHDFCMEKAKKDGFLQVVDRNDLDGISAVYDQRRLSFHCRMDDLLQANPYGFSVRSLFISNSKRNDMSFISQNFMLLRVLNLAFLTINDSMDGITFLIHLRYLAFGSRKTPMPSSIANLSNLQYLLVANYFDSVKERTDVPDSLWDMVNLRNVKIDYNAYFDIHSSRFENSSFMHNLESLSTPCFYSDEDAENLLRRLPKLRKLKCIFMYCWGNCHKFSGLHFLDQLVSLNVHFNGPTNGGMRCKLNFPLNLQKLTLSGFGLYWNEISKFGRLLPNLNVLKLIGKFEDETWIVNEGDFPKLKYLKLDRLEYLLSWIASEDSFPILEQLVLENCEKLNEIPPCVGEIPTMRMITVRGCLPSVDDSARRIQMEQHEEWQNMDLEVRIS